MIATLGDGEPLTTLCPQRREPQAMEEGVVFLTRLLGTRCWLMGGPLPGATWIPGLGVVGS